MKSKAITKSRLSNTKKRFTDSVGSRNRFSVWRCSAIGFGVSVGLAVLLCLLLTAILIGADDPAALAAPTAFSILYVSAFVGGAVASCLKRGSAVLCGLAVGLAILLLTFLLSFTADSSLASDYGFTEAALLRTAIPACSLLGAVAIKKQPTPNRQKNYKKR